MSDSTDISGLDINSIGIIGAGQMGCGIAHVCAAAGFDVKLSDVNEDQLAKAVRPSAATWTGRSSTATGRGRQDGGACPYRDRNRLCAILGLRRGDRVGDRDEEVKREILKALCPALKSEAIVCTNTSSISVTRLAAVTDRPGRFMGMHFMNPVPVMKLVELIRGIATDEDTYQAIRELALKLDKTPAMAEDFPAFIVNRILLPMINEAVYTLYEGVGSVQSIDTAMKLGANHPMGPLELADFIGLDTCLAVMHVLYDGLADSKYRPCPLLVKYVEAGWLGRKAGRGFYDYSGDEPVPTR